MVHCMGLIPKVIGLISLLWWWLTALLFYVEPAATAWLANRPVCYPSPSQCRVARSTSRPFTRCPSPTAFSRTRSTTIGLNDAASCALVSSRATLERTTFVATFHCRPRRRFRSAIVVEFPSCRSVGTTSTQSAPEWRPATRWHRSPRCSSSTGRRSSMNGPTSAYARVASASNTTILQKPPGGRLVK